MIARNQELYNIIETLPEELSIKVLEYIDFLKYAEVINKAPEHLIIKDKKDLINAIANQTVKIDTLMDLQIK